MTHSSHKNYKTWTFNPFETEKMVVTGNLKLFLAVSEAYQQDKPQKVRCANPKLSILKEVNVTILQKT